MSDPATQGRNRILGAVRGALKAGAKDAERIAAVKQRIESHKSNLIPERARAADQERIALFVEYLEGQGVDIRRAEGAEAVPKLVANYLRDNNLPATIKTGADPVLGEMPWDRVPALQRHEGQVIGDDQVAMSRAVTAAAETGTLFLVSGADNPTTHNFLPETHIIAIAASDVSGSYEDAWNSLRSRFGERALPRAVNLISGPSRTADIEQTIIMGAHGPRRLLVVIID